MYNEIIDANYLDKDMVVSCFESDPDQLLLAIVPESSSERKISEMEFIAVSLDAALIASQSHPSPLAVVALFHPCFRLTHTYENLRIELDNLSIPFLLYSRVWNLNACKLANELGFDDYCFGIFSESLQKKFHIINQTKLHRNSVGVLHPSVNSKILKTVSILSKRILDISVSILILVILFPVLLLIALLIKLESKGPIFYISKRAGNNYQVFNFYKFRSMSDGAETLLKDLMNKNQYATGAFVKIKSDPRVTSFGSFLRKSSLDEIPQLINVIRGDMSLVGNRPLPLYEAVELTKDQVARRFLAPAGITGLWQITKRGKEHMSDEERIKLDVIYAQKTSFLYDMKLLIRTIPAMWQKESV